MNTNEIAIQTLKNEAKSFFPETKKFLKSCTFAAMDVNENGIVDMWGDFKNRKDALTAIRMWGILSAKLNGKISSSLQNNKYRIVVEFQS